MSTISAKWGFNPDPDATDEVDVQQEIEKAMGYVDGLAAKLANQASHQQGVEYEDLRSVGYLQLVAKAETWDPDQGTLFNYARPRILGEMHTHLAERIQNMKIPEKVHHLAYKIREHEADLLKELQREPTADELAARLLHAENMDVTHKQIRDAHMALAATEPVQPARNEDNEYLHPTETLEGGLATHTDNDRTSNMLQALAKLEPAEQAILRSEAGLDGPRMTIDQISRTLGISYRDVSQISRLAKIKMMHPVHEGCLTY